MKAPREAFHFMEGGGEMGALTRNYDWARSILGEPANWPQSLRTTLGIVLHSAFPMFLFWGKELLCFYNDAFRPSLGVDGKHPSIGKTGREVWPEIWEFIGPLINQVMRTGKPVWFEDQLVPFFRNGRVEDIYWTFSYSPAYGDDGGGKRRFRYLYGNDQRSEEPSKAGRKRAALQKDGGRDGHPYCHC